MAILFLAAALAASETSAITDERTAPPPLAPHAVLAIPAELQSKFEGRLRAAGPSEQRRLEAVVDFIFKPSGLGLTYDADATHTVAEAYQTRRGNCLTFTLLAVALAREAGLNAYGQAMENTLAWRLDGGVVYRTNHVNAGIAVDQRRFSVDVAQDSVLTQKPPEKIADGRLLAMYYNNRAAELSGAGRASEATPYMTMSLQLDPGYASSWSNAGVLLARSGDVTAAERSYRRALEIDPTHSATLFNIAGLYQRSGDAAKANVYRRQLDTVQLKDPFHQFQIALDNEKKGDYPRAVQHYRRAIAIHPREHRFHYGLARAYLQSGELRRADRALTRAHELSAGTTQEQYMAKLERLRSTQR